MKESARCCMVSLREKGVDLNATFIDDVTAGLVSPFVRREWI